MEHDPFLYVALAALTVLNLVIPFSGSATVTPIIAFFTEPHNAIAFATFYFFMSSCIRSYLFRTDIQWNEVRRFLLPSLIAALVGALALFTIPANVILVILFFFTLSFLIKKLGKSTEKKQSTLTTHVVSILSGFLQGTGLAGSDLRNGYLYAQGYTLAQVHGTTALIGAANFLVATVVRLGVGSITIPNLVPLLALFPVLLIGTLIGKHIIYKIPKRIADIIIILVLIGILVMLGVMIVERL